MAPLVFHSSPPFRLHSISLSKCPRQSPGRQGDVLSSSCGLRSGRCVAARGLVRAGQPLHHAAMHVGTALKAPSHNQVVNARTRQRKGNDRGPAAALRRVHPLQIFRRSQPTSTTCRQSEAPPPQRASSSPSQPPNPKTHDNAGLAQPAKMCCRQPGTAALMHKWPLPNPQGQAKSSTVCPPSEARRDLGPPPMSHCRQLFGKSPEQPKRDGRMDKANIH